MAWKGVDNAYATALDLFNGSWPPGLPLVFLGKPEDIRFDVVAEINFKDEEHFKKFSGVFGDAENAKRLADDEEKFLDRSSLKAVLLGDVKTTTGVTQAQVLLGI